MIEAVGNKIVVKPIEVKTESDGGIYIPKTQTQKPQIGKIISLGEGLKHTFSAGEDVMFKMYSGVEIEYEDEKYIVIEIEDVLVTIKED